MDFFSNGGLRIAYIDVPSQDGAGDPVILIHGFARPIV